MAISSAYLRCSQSNTSSVNPWSAPSGITISRTGRSRLESQQAAAQTSWRCSILAVICSRLRTPRTVGEMPTAVYDCTAFAISRPPFNAVTADDSTQGAGEESCAKSRYKNHIILTQAEPFCSLTLALSQREREFMLKVQVKRLRLTVGTANAYDAGWS